MIRHGNNGREFQPLLELGLSPIDVLRAATSHAAAAVGLETSIGALAPGRSADIVGLDGDPLRDPSALQRVAFVMHRGVLIKRQSLRSGCRVQGQTRVKPAVLTHVCV